MEQVKLILATAVVTVLIWTMADRLLSDTVEVEVIVSPQPAPGTGMIVATDPPGQERFEMTLAGPRRVVEQVRREGGLSVVIQVPNVPSGSRRIDVMESLADYTEQFRGLRVESVDPPFIDLLVDHYQTVTMPVQVGRGDLEYEVPPAVEPSEVAVTISELALKELGNQRRVVLDVEELLRDKPEGVPQRIEGVPLPTHVGDIEVDALEPDTVTVFATLREQVKTGTVAAVPIVVGASTEVFNRYRVETRDGSTLITRAITVSGPPTMVDRLVGKDIRVTGLIYLTGDLAAQADTFRELNPTFDLPPGVRLTGAVAPVVFRLVRTEGAAGP